MEIAGSSNNDVIDRRDKYNFVYFIFLVCGVGSILPWNFFINAQRYFEYQMRNKSLPKDVDFTDLKYATDAQKTFLSYVVLCSILPYTISTFGNLFVAKWLSSYFRFISGGVLVSTMFLLSVIMTAVSIDSTAFLVITLSSAVIINIGASLFQSSLIGIAAVLPSQIMSAAMNGQAVAGIIASLANILTTAVSSNPTTSGMLLFLVALIIILSSMVLFFLLQKNSYFLHYWHKSGRDKTGNDSDELISNKDSAKSAQALTLSDLLHSFKEVAFPGTCVLLVLAVTLSIFPATLANIVPMHLTPSDPWTTKYFVPVVVFLSYNVFDWVGRMLGGFLKWPRKHHMWLIFVFVLLRLLFIPICLLCNIHPRRYLPVWFVHDAYPIILVILLGLSNGYLMMMVMIYGPSYASPGRCEIAGVALTVYISLGLAIGVLLSAFIVMLFKNESKIL